MPDSMGFPTYAEKFAAALNEKFPAVKSYDNVYGVTVGQKFDRITTDNKDGGHLAVHAFVERSTGLLIKSAGWKAPAKRADGSLQSQFELATDEGFATAVEAADRHGSYLYVR